MQTRLSEDIRNTPLGQEADVILRSCVHCGFCNATCPTYQLLGDELDGPRGRIYLIKQVLEGETPSAKTQTHLDRCLTCLSCETTCPSGVRYSQLLEIGRELTEQRVSRPLGQRLLREALLRVLPYPKRFGMLMRLACSVRGVLPTHLRKMLPTRDAGLDAPTGSHPRRMLLMDGCVQPALAPAINTAAARVFDRLGIELIRARGAGCCGALSHHLSAPAQAKNFMRRNIDAWWPHIERGAEAIAITASGCGVTVKDYGRLLADDPTYAEKAKRVGALARDVAELVQTEDLDKLKVGGKQLRVAFHAPCTLQHGQQIRGVVEKILAGLGYDLAPVSDAHLCCGSAGTYSLLQKDLSQRLLERKLASLQATEAEIIATANIGCLQHLQKGAAQPVKHWLELLA